MGVLPALGWFCQFSGIGVIFCFTFQITIFLPCLVLNARREEATRFDCCCCCKTGRDNTLSNKDTPLEKTLGKFAKIITSTTGTVMTLLIFTGFLAVGVLGMTKIYKDFKLEWFLPDDSYVNTFIKANGQYFQSGVPVTIYFEDLNYFEKQDTLIKMHAYKTRPDSFFDPNEEVNDWYKAFMDASRSGDNANNWLNADKTQFTDRTTFYAQLHLWYKDGGGARYRTLIKWSDSNCDISDTWDICNPQLGIKATKMGGTIMLKYTRSGDERYKTLDAMRKQIGAIDAKAFPYTFNFAYWEEVGIIDVELTRNLIICACVVIFMISAMIPHPRIAVFVMLSIILSVVDLVGFLYFWDVTISSISTIYILISVGLAVDYSAHIAHMFVSASGSGPQRAEEALMRIGPWVFNAITSTMLAVAVLATSNSFIFRVFFKALFLTVLFGGLHGLWLLPTLLALFGGENEKVSPRIDEKDLEAVKSVDVEMTESNVGGGGAPPQSYQITR